MGIVLTEHGVNETHQEWRELSQCKIEGIPVHDFYDGPVERTREAVAACGRCAVQTQCLQYALDNNEGYGYWSSTSVRSRRNIKRTGLTAVQWLEGVQNGVYSLSVPGRGRPPKRPTDDY